MRKRAMRPRVDHEKKSDGVKVHHEKKSDRGESSLREKGALG